MSTVIKTDNLAFEFATVDALMTSGGTTRRTDAFILTWVKMEKQLRRLFCFLVYQHSAFGKSDQDSLVKVIVGHPRLFFYTFIQCINKLGPPTVEDLVGPRYDHFTDEIKRIQKYRNKMFHGQITGQDITSRQLEKDTKLVRAWINALASGAEDTLGYDGVGRNTFEKAKAATQAMKHNYPFSTVREFENWLARMAPQ